MTIKSLDLGNFIKPWSSFLSKNQKEVKEEMSCVICLDMHKNPTITNCHHIFCKICIDTHLYTYDNCPLCRTKITELRLAQHEVTVIIKKALGLGCSPAALDALKTSEDIIQYEQCRNKIQKHIMESRCFAGPWCCELPEKLNENIVFKLRHQLELRGFSLFSVFNDKDKIYCRIIGNRAENITTSEESIGWDLNFSPKKIFEIGEEKLNTQRKHIQDSNISESEKSKQHLLLIFEGR